MEILLILLVVGCLGVFYFNFIRWTLYKGWDKFSLHKCGHLEYLMPKHPCPKCGMSDRDWKTVYARYHLFGGWEWKEPNGE